ncbi:MAG TPA: preprotein translocase subunit SecG [Rhodospirillales bacterium]|nr:preprotein translocase subunit SecG [Rhodospirillales bacterium]
MVTVILVIHLLLAFVLVITVLLQQSEGGGLGMGGGGGMGGFMTSRATANLLTRATAITAAAFMSTSLLLAILSGDERESRSVLDKPAPATSGPAEPVLPSAPLGQ